MTVHLQSRKDHGLEIQNFGGEYEGLGGSIF